MFLASHTVQVTSDANNRPIMTDCTTTSADMNMSQGDMSRGRCALPMPGTSATGAAWPAASAGSWPQRATVRSAGHAYPAGKHLCQQIVMPRWTVAILKVLSTSRLAARRANACGQDRCRVPTLHMPASSSQRSLRVAPVDLDRCIYLKVRPIADQIVVNAGQAHAGRILHAALARELLNGLVEVEQQGARAVIADHALQPEK